MSDICLEVSRVDKSYAAPALRQVSLTVRRGEIHAIVGENGAGKSTLVNILAGHVHRDSGDLAISGEPYAPRNTREALSAGVSLATQELSIVDELSVAENLVLRAIPNRRSIVAVRDLHDEAKRLLTLVALDDIDPSARAGSLRLAERQLVELARAFRFDVKLLILDEPTAALTAPQAEHIHGLTRRAARKGTAVIYISHRLDDVLSLADRVTVLRDGEVVSTAPAETLSTEQLLSQMSGKTHTDAGEDRTSNPHRQALLEARVLTTAELPHPIDLTCRAGEIVGVAGLAGAGKSELLNALFALDRPLSGDVVRRVGNDDVPLRNAAHAVELNVGYLGEDRRSMGLFANRSVIENLRIPGRRRRFLAGSDRTEREAARQLLDELEVRHESLDQTIDQLSGGNQQKVLLARWLFRGVDVLLLDEPTRGVDVGTKHAIYRLLSTLSTEGKAIVVASSEIDELTTVADRIVVLSNLRLAAEFTPGEYAEDAILQAAFSYYGRPASETHVRIGE